MTSSFSITICWRGCLICNIYFWHLCWESDGCTCVGVFLGSLLYSTGLHVCFYADIKLLSQLWLCSMFWNQTLWCLQHCSLYSGLLWLYNVFSAFKWILGSFSSSVKNVIRFFMGIALNLWTTFSNIAIFTILIFPIHKHEWSFPFSRVFFNFFL
jgi:hypothetical protein